MTHLGLDHVGGLVDFPQARVHVHAAELDAAMRRRTFRDRHRYLPPMWAHEPHWETYSEEGEPWFGFEAVRNLRGLPAEILLVPLFGHPRPRRGRARREGWMLHAGDAYFDPREVHGPQRRRCAWKIGLLPGDGPDAAGAASAQPGTLARVHRRAHPEVRVFNRPQPLRVSGRDRRGRSGGPALQRARAADRGTAAAREGGVNPVWVAFVAACSRAVRVHRGAARDARDLAPPVPGERDRDQREKWIGTLREGHGGVHLARRGRGGPSLGAGCGGHPLDMRYCMPIPRWCRASSAWCRSAGTCACSSTPRRRVTARWWARSMPSRTTCWKATSMRPLVTARIETVAAATQVVIRQAWQRVKGGN